MRFGKQARDTLIQASISVQGKMKCEISRLQRGVDTSLHRLHALPCDVFSFRLGSPILLYRGIEWMLILAARRPDQLLDGHFIICCLAHFTYITLGKKKASAE